MLHSRHRAQRASKHQLKTYRVRDSPEPTLPATLSVKGKVLGSLSMRDSLGPATSTLIFAPARTLTYLPSPHGFAFEDHVRSDPAALAYPEHLTTIGPERSGWAIITTFYKLALLPPCVSEMSPYSFAQAIRLSRSVVDFLDHTSRNSHYRPLKKTDYIIISGRVHSSSKSFKRVQVIITKLLGIIVQVHRIQKKFFVEAPNHPKDFRV
jgi:hypothetical protein